MRASTFRREAVNVNEEWRCSLASAAQAVHRLVGVLSSAYRAKLPRGFLKDPLSIRNDRGLDESVQHY
jgi:hypothetical protein